LASLKGICTVALLDVKDPLAIDYFNKLDLSADKLNVILTRLLIVNQINHASINPDSIGLSDLVDEVIVLETKKGLPKGLLIKKEIPDHITLHTDRDLVRIILENLIDNAIKFHNDSGRVEPFVLVRAETNDEHKSVTIRVIDNGIGISEVKPDKIFQMFSRASERSGTGGIGLYLSKLATEKLGGEINLGVTAEGYTEFTVTFQKNRLA
jgi:signal transduction histidine kinase